MENISFLFFFRVSVGVSPFYKTALFLYYLSIRYIFAEQLTPCPPPSLLRREGKNSSAT